MFSNIVFLAPQLRIVPVQDGCPSGNVCANVINADPKFNPLANNGGYAPIFSLQTGSPAIDAGNNLTCATMD